MDVKFFEKVVQSLNRRGWTLGFAESCTGGLISAQLTQFPGVSSVFNGGIVSYSNEIKAKLLNVPLSALKTHGAVSAPVAKYMAIGAKDALRTDVALSVTGIAGPGGGSKNKPVGLVFIAVVGPGFEKVERHIFTGSNGSQLSRQEIQVATAVRAFKLLCEMIVKQN